MNVVSKDAGSTLRRSAHGQATLALLLVTSMGAGISSCSQLVDPDKTQCKVDEDCTALFGVGSDLFCRQNVCVAPSCTTNEDCQNFGADYTGTICNAMGACVKTSQEPPEWQCLDKPAVPTTEPGPFTVHGRASHMVTQKAIAGAAVRVCRKLDATCEVPDATAVTDANGEFTVTLTRGFSGYAAVSFTNLMTTEYFLNPAVDADTDLGTIQMAETSAAALLASSGGATLIPGRGILLVSTQNCDKKAAPGIRFTSVDADASTTAFYAIGGLPSKTATETDSAGFGGFINVAPGYFTVEAQRVSDNRPTARFGVQVKSDTLVITRLIPSML